MKTILLSLIAALVTMNATIAQADIARPRTREAVSIARLLMSPNYQTRQSDQEVIVSASVIADGRLIIRTTDRIFFDEVSNTNLRTIKRAATSLALAELETTHKNVICEVMLPEFRPTLVIGRSQVLEAPGCGYSDTTQPKDEKLKKLAIDTLELIRFLADRALVKERNKQE